MLIFAAIRMVDGEELPWSPSARMHKDETVAVCDRTRRMTPEWDASYPVVRIARFQCKEI